MQTEIAQEDTRRLLEQWGRWSRSGGYNGGAKSILGALCESGYRVSAPAIEITDEMALRVDKAVCELDVDGLYHRVIILYFVIGKSGEKVAKILNIPRSSAYAAISSAVDEIHEILYPQLSVKTACTY